MANKRDSSIVLGDEATESGGILTRMMQKMKRDPAVVIGRSVKLVD